MRPLAAAFQLADRLGAIGGVYHQRILAVPAMNEEKEELEFEGESRDSPSCYLAVIRRR